MATQHLGYIARRETPLHLRRHYLSSHPRKQTGEDHSNWDMLLGSSGKPHSSTRARSTPTSSTGGPRPLGRGGLTYRDDLPIHDGLLNQGPESLPPKPMAESNNKEDIMVDKSTFGSWRKKKGKPKARKCKSKKKQESKEVRR